MEKELEILKLKKMLEDANIPFDFTDHMRISYNGEPEYQIIIKDKENPEVRLCDAVYHQFSYGYDQNLLEIMGGLTEEEKEIDSVLGWLTAEDVFERFKYCYEHNTDIFIEEDKGE